MATTTIQAKFTTTRKELAASLIERDDEIDIALTALICKQHPLFVGPPGTGKSMLADAIVSWLEGSKFSILLNKFSTPEDVFGPIDVMGLTENRYRRVTTGMLPESSIAFMDEMFKASPAILNTTLKCLNERTFKNDGTERKIPLRMCVAASNEWPNAQDGAKELNALFDRFLFRKTVHYIRTATGRNRLLEMARDRKGAPRLSTTITPEELDTAFAESGKLAWTAEAWDGLSKILNELKAAGIEPGDRRQLLAVDAVRAFAYMHGAERIEPDHLEILAHVLWDDPTEQPAKCAQIVARVANPIGMKVNALVLEAEQILASVDPRNLASASSAIRNQADQTGHR